MNPVDTLLFGTAGAPHSTKPRDSVTAVKRLSELGLDAMELEYVYGSFPGEDKARSIADAARKHSIRLTAHGPYYINLNAVEPEKREASRKRVYNTAFYGGLSGAESITFHAGFFLKQPAETVYKTIKDELEGIVETIHSQGIETDVRLELTGKATQFGSLDEILSISQELEGVHPCIDWSHLHARSGAFNTADEFQSVLDRVRDVLGERELKHLHMHLSGIEYTAKGERKHLPLDDSDMNYRDLLRVLKDNGVFGILICESPTLEDDALILKDYYSKL